MQNRGVTEVARPLHAALGTKICLHKPRTRKAHSGDERNAPTCSNRAQCMATQHGAKIVQTFPEFSLLPKLDQSADDSHRPAEYDTRRLPNTNSLPSHPGTRLLPRERQTKNLFQRLKPM